MKYLVTAAAAALMSAGAAQAATVDLTYTVEAVVTDTRYSSDNGSTEGIPYTGPEIGDVLNYQFDIEIDPTTTGTSVNLDGGPGSLYNVANFDAATGAMDYYYVLNENPVQFSLEADGTGTGQDLIYLLFPTYADTALDVTSWSVDGLPAAVPLPASLPLLVVGAAAIGLVSRRRR